MGPGMQRGTVHLLVLVASPRAEARGPGASAWKGGGRRIFFFPGAILPSAGHCFPLALLKWSQPAQLSWT